MSCSLAAFAACFQLSGFYLDGHYAFADSGIENSTLLRHTSVVYRDSVRETWSTEATSYDLVARRQNIRIALGYSVDVTPRCFIYVEASHASDPRTGRDRGINAAAIGSRCRLFGGAR